MKKNRKHLLITLCLMLVVCVVSVGGTLAWLADNAGPVVNTFAPTGIDISLVETCDPNFEMVPGVTYEKDPVVSVDKADVDVYLFVKVTGDGTTKQFVEYKLAWEHDGHTQDGNCDCGWIKLENATTDGSIVYYRTVASADVSDNTKWELIDGSTVKIKDGLGGAIDMPTTDVKLEFEAYAIQQVSGTDENGDDIIFEPLAAWRQAVTEANN